MKGGREALRRKLPAYMVPSRYTVLKTLPLTPNGKVDRSRLKTMAPVAESGGAHVEPRTPEEKTVAAIWREVLQLDAVGVHDDFFDIGGHSLAAVSIAGKLRAAFGANVGVCTFRTAPTVARMAEHVAKAGSCSELSV